MKTLLVLIGIILLSVTMSKGQNYIGLSLSKIEKKYGKPDEKGANFIVYMDNREEGTNTYYFDETGNCNAFVITRASGYFNDYQKMLKKDFTQTLTNKYQSNSKSLNYIAEVSKLENEFQIRITQIDPALKINPNTVCNVV
jgi:hypothetical protein